MTDSKKMPRTEDELDAALKGTFPASDPVSPPSHVEEEKERRRKVLEQDAMKKAPRSADVRTDSPGRIILPMDTRKNSRHTEDALDEALQETFPASDPVSVDAAVHEDELRRRAAKIRRKAPRRKTRAAGKKKPTAKKRKSPSKARKKVASKKRARR